MWEGRHTWNSGPQMISRNEVYNCNGVLHARLHLRQASKSTKDARQTVIVHSMGESRCRGSYGALRQGRIGSQRKEYIESLQGQPRPSAQGVPRMTSAVEDDPGQA